MRCGDVEWQENEALEGKAGRWVLRREEFLDSVRVREKVDLIAC